MPRRKLGRKPKRKPVKRRRLGVVKSVVGGASDFIAKNLPLGGVTRYLVRKGARVGYEFLKRRAGKMLVRVARKKGLVKGFVSNTKPTNGTDGGNSVSYFPPYVIHHRMRYRLTGAEVSPLITREDNRIWGIDAINSNL